MPTLRDIATVAGRMVQLGAHIACERLTGYRPTDPAQVPPSAEAITPEWLTAVLCKDYPGARVISVEVTGGSSGTSDRRSLRVAYNAAGQDAGLPIALFSKATALWTQRLILGLAGLIRGETGFYSQIRPRVGMEAPWGYYAAYEPRSWRSLILMEDIVATKDVTFCSPLTEISRERMEDLLANMAAWHAAFWNSAQFAGELSWLMTPARFQARTSALINMQTRSVLGAQRAEQMIPKALFPRQQELWAAYARSFDLLSRAPMTLLHGDSHIGNTYITGDGRMGFCDWQIVQKGGWAYDYALTVTTGLKVEDRRRWEADLLRFYLDRLRAAGVEAPTFDQAWLAYRQSTIYPYYSWTYTVGAGTLQPDMQPRDICLRNIERTSHAIQDLDSLQALAA